MKTLLEIVESVKSNGKPEYDEIRYALLALESLLAFESMAIRKLAEGEIKKKKPFLTYSAEFQHKESFRRNKTAFSKSPKEWVGWNNNPENPDYQKSRAVFVKLGNKLLEGK